MKKQLLVLLSIGLILLGCNVKEKKIQDVCSIKIKDKVEILLPGDAKNFKKSPLENSKIWVKINYKGPYEIDLINRNIKKISALKYSIISPSRERTITHDHFDSLVWIGGKHKLLQYNKISKKISDFDLYKVDKIFPAEKKVYFIADKHHYYWDRINKTIKEIVAIPTEKIIVKKNPAKKEQQRPLDYPLPKVNGLPFNHISEKNRLWIFRKQQLFLYDSLDLKFKNFDIEEDSLRSVQVDDCFIYLLHKHKFEFYDKEKFIKSAKEFDQKAYQKELANYKLEVQSLLKETTNLDSILSIVEFVTTKYQNTSNIDILADLKQIQIYAFNNVDKTDPNFHNICLANLRLPLSYRKVCFVNAFWSLRTLVRKGIFDQAIDLYDKNKTMIDLHKESIYDHSLSTIKTYESFVDSLELSDSSQEKIVYFKAEGLSKVCSTIWFVGEVCHNYSLMNQKLNEFIVQYPDSEYVDNAKWKKLTSKCFGEGGYEDAELIRIINAYQDLFNEYPNTDISSKIKSTIIEYAEMIHDKEKFKKEYEDLKLNYFNDNN